MKKKLFGLCLLIPALLFSSCKRSEPTIIDPDTPIESGGDVPDIPPVPPIPPVPIPVTLNAPVLNLDKNTGVVSWSAIEDAEYYRYYINNGDFVTTTNTSITLEEGQSISVMADSSQEHVTPSSWSNPVSYVNIDETYKYANVHFINVPGMNSIAHPKGIALSINTNPTNGQYVFDGWYKDAFFKDVFTNGEIINDDIKLYAKWNAPTYMNANFFVKCNNHLSNNEKGYKPNDNSSSSWGFVPLHYDADQTSALGNRKTFSAIVTSDSSSSESNPAEYLVMDGVDDLTGRKYWKAGEDANFTVKSPGTWKISFSIEYEWDYHGTMVHAHLDSYTSQMISYTKSYSVFANDILATPNVTLSKDNSKASWDAINGASKYQYSINGGEFLETNATEVNLYQGQYIIVRAIGDSNTLSSKWSRPIVFNYSEPLKSDYSYVTFFNSDVPSLKVNKGTIISNPGIPSKAGYTFDNWYSDITLKTPFDFSAPINKNTVVYAKWNLITDTNRYYLMSPSNTKVVELHLNTAQESFNEYYATFRVESNEEGLYKVVDSLNNNKVLYTHQIDDTNCEYQICFSFDHMYGNNRFGTVNHTRYTLYFTNNMSSKEPYAYYWSETISSRKVEWPGTKMTFEKNNSYGQAVYSISLYKDYYSHIIFNNGDNGKQTINISLNGVVNKTQWWTDGQDEAGKYKVASGIYND